MQYSDIPTKFTIPFANNAGGSYTRVTPTPSQIGIEDGAASLTDGFPPLNFLSIGAGGIPPFGQDFNGILNRTTAWARWFNAGGTVKFDATLSTAIGGYPKWAVVASATISGLFWVSIADNNTTDPEGGTPTNWLPMTSPAASRVIIAAGPQNLLASDTNVFINQTVAAAITLNLPAAPVPMQVTVIDDKGDAGTNTINVSGNGNLINGASSFALNQNYQSATFIWRSGATQFRIK